MRCVAIRLTLRLCQGNDLSMGPISLHDNLLTNTIGCASCIVLQFTGKLMAVAIVK